MAFVLHLDDAMLRSETCEGPTLASGAAQLDTYSHCSTIISRRKAAKEANSLDDVDALAALHRFGTVSEAATWLRLTQSAVSKRLQSIQRAVGFTMLERDGRRIRLTPQAIDFLERARPLVASLRSLMRRRATRPCDGLTLTMSESIAASWGPSAVQMARAKMGNPDIVVHVEPGALALESLRLGRTDLALCTSPRDACDLDAHAIVDEPMIIVFAGLRTAFDAHAPLVLIEPTSATWLSTEHALEARHVDLLDGDVVRVASFSLMLQLVRAGFGNGIMPCGHAMTMPLPTACHRRLDGVTRPVRLHSRRGNTGGYEGVVLLRKLLATAAASSLATA